MRIFSSCLRPGRLKRALRQVPVIMFWLLVWEGANFLVGSDIIIVSPRAAFARLGELGRTAEFWGSVGTSFGRISRGFALALGAGIAIAVAASASRLFSRLVQPAINAINAVPIASFTLLALMALSSRQLSVFVAFITVLPIIFYNTRKGVESTDRQLLEMAAAFDVPLWKQIIYIYVKTIAPYVLSAATAGVGFAWKSGVAAELIGVVRGTIGASLHTARVFLQTADLFAWTIAIVLLSYATERAFALIFGRVIKWRSN